MRAAAHRTVLSQCEKSEHSINANEAADYTHLLYITSPFPPVNTSPLPLSLQNLYITFNFSLRNLPRYSLLDCTSSNMSGTSSGSGSGSGSNSGSRDTPKPPPRKQVSAAFKKALEKLVQNPDAMQRISDDAEASKFFDPSSPSNRKYLFTKFVSLS
jgi:hypothetical protein